MLMLLLSAWTWNNVALTVRALEWSIHSAIRWQEMSSKVLQHEPFTLTYIWQHSSDSQYGSSHLAFCLVIQQHPHSFGNFKTLIATLFNLTISSSWLTTHPDRRIPGRTLISLQHDLHTPVLDDEGDKSEKGTLSHFVVFENNTTTYQYYPSSSWSFKHSELGFIFGPHIPAASSIVLVASAFNSS